MRIEAFNLQEEERALRQMRSQGWAGVDESAVCFVDSIFDASVPPGWRRPSIAALLSELRTTPVALDRSFLRDASLDGVMPSGTPYRSGYTGLTRLLVHPELSRLIFIENEYALTGGRMRILFEELRERVHGFPMIYFVAKAPSGAAQTCFVWFTPCREYQLFLKRAVMTDDPWYSRIYADLIYDLP